MTCLLQRAQRVRVARWWHEPECHSLRGDVAGQVETVLTHKLTAVKFKRVLASE